MGVDACLKCGSKTTDCECDTTFPAVDFETGSYRFYDTKDDMESGFSIGKFPGRKKVVLSVNNKYCTQAVGSFTNEGCAHEFAACLLRLVTCRKVD